MNKISLYILILGLGAFTLVQWSSLEKLNLQVDEFSREVKECRSDIKSLEKQQSLRESLKTSLQRVFHVENAPEILENATGHLLTVTAYSPRPQETDDTPFITASNSRVREGIVAVSPDLYRQGWKFGRKVYVENYGVYVIEDLMGKRTKKHLDIFFDDTENALEFGKRKLRVYLLDS